MGLASERPGFDSLPGHVTLTSSCPLPDLSLQICKMNLPRLRLLLGTQRRVKTGRQEGGCGYFVMDSASITAHKMGGFLGPAGTGCQSF